MFEKVHLDLYPLWWFFCKNVRLWTCKYVCYCLWHVFFMFANSKHFLPQKKVHVWWWFGFHTTRNHFFSKCSTWLKYPQWPKGIFTLNKGLGHERLFFYLCIKWLKWHFFTISQFKHLVKKGHNKNVHQND